MKRGCITAWIVGDEIEDVRWEGARHGGFHQELWELERVWTSEPEGIREGFWMRLSELLALSTPSATHLKMFTCKRRVCSCSTPACFGVDAVLRCCFNS